MIPINNNIKFQMKIIQMIIKIILNMYKSNNIKNERSFLN